MATAMLSLLVCRALVISSPFRDMRRHSTTAVAIPRQLSRYGKAPSCAMQAIAAHLAVPRPSRNRDFGHDNRRQGCATGPLVIRPDIGPVAQPWRRPSPHGESLRAMAKPSPWRDFYDGDIAPRRHSSPFGDTYQPLATSIAIWRHIS